MVRPTKQLEVHSGPIVAKSWRPPLLSGWLHIDCGAHHNPAVYGWLAFNNSI